MPVEITRWAIKPLHRSARGFDERLAIVVPWLARAVLALAARARRGSRLRRAVFGHALRVGISKSDRRDYESLYAFLSPEVELHVFPDAPDERPIDARPVYQGHDGYVEMSDAFQAEFEDFRWELRELFDPGGDRIGGRVGRSGRGGRSGVVVRGTDFHIWQFERGLVRRQFALRSESEMLAMLEPMHQLSKAGVRAER